MLCCVPGLLITFEGVIEVTEGDEEGVGGVFVQRVEVVVGFVDVLVVGLVVDCIGIV